MLRWEPREQKLDEALQHSVASALLPSYNTVASSQGDQADIRLTVHTPPPSRCSGCQGWPGSAACSHPGTAQFQRGKTFHVNIISVLHACLHHRTVQRYLQWSSTSQLRATTSCFGCFHISVSQAPHMNTSVYHQWGTRLLGISVLITCADTKDLAANLPIISSSGPIIDWHGSI